MFKSYKIMSASRISISVTKIKGKQTWRKPNKNRKAALQVQHVTAITLFHFLPVTLTSFVVYKVELVVRFFILRRKARVTASSALPLL